jgi:hypothetical protein
MLSAICPNNSLNVIRLLLSVFSKPQEQRECGKSHEKDVPHTKNVREKAPTGTKMSAIRAGFRHRYRPAFFFRPCQMRILCSYCNSENDILIFYFVVSYLPPRQQKAGANTAQTKCFTLSGRICPGFAPVGNARLQDT